MEKIKNVWLDFFNNDQDEKDWWDRKRLLCHNREAGIVRISGKGECYEEVSYLNNTRYRYLLHLTFLLKQQDHFIREEHLLPFEFRVKNGQILDHKKIEKPILNEDTVSIETETSRDLTERRFSYDRHAAVQYAERWWNSYNPEYRTFSVDCTNFVSQCLRAGGAPMRGAPVRERGWWYQEDNWSFSWAVAHSLRWYLSGSTTGLKGKEMETAEELIPGDVICYDFQGDDRWDHNTIVVAKDAYGMPLVNAHTDNSRHRDWSYTDSTAWTPDIRYKFFRIG